MEADALLRYLVALGVWSVPAYLWWERSNTRAWPTTDARVIEAEPQTLFEDGHLNTDSDFAIEYEVGGRRYVQTPEIENNVRIGGFKVHRSPSIPKEFRVRYNDANPSQYSIVHLHSTRLLCALTLGCVVIGFVALLLGVSP